MTTISIAASYSASQGQHYPRHRHTSWELIYYRSGHIECVLEPQNDGESQRVVESSPGMVLIIPPRTIHSDRVHSDFSQFYVRLYRDSPLQPWPEIVFDDVDGSLRHLFNSLVREWSAPATRFKDELLGILVRQLEIALERQAQQRVSRIADDLVREAEKRIEAYLSNTPTVKDLAEALSVSTSTLRAHFAHVRGYSPQHYLHRLRLERALELIQSSTLNLESVASLCGYYSASHLNRHVKRATGRTPGDFRPQRSVKRT